MACSRAYPRRGWWTHILCLSSLLSFLVVWVALAQDAARPEGPGPILKVDVSLVNLTATVLDGAGRPRPGLKKDDFVVYEDGVPQEIAVFSNAEDIPVSLGIVFDTSGSMVDKIEEVGDAVVHLINLVNPEDEIFVMRFSTDVSLVQNFTSDRRRLQRAVKDLQARGSTALYDAVVEGLQVTRNGKHQRKALLVITDGNDTSSKMRLKETVDLAVRSELPIYNLGIGHGERGSFGHLPDLFRDTVDVDALLALSDATGGKTFVLQGPHQKGGVDQIDRACLEVAAELRQQYALGYYPRRGRTDGNYRRIEVEVPKGNFKVRTRDGYFPASQAAPSRPRPR